MANRIVFLLLALLLAPTAAHAANRCTLTAGGTCASYHATIQEAVTAAGPVDNVIIGPEAHVEDVTVDHALNAVKFQTGASLTGALRIVNVPSEVEVLLPLILSPGAIGLEVVGSAHTSIVGGTITCLAGGVGVRYADGNEYAIGPLTTISGCAIGLDVENVTGLYVNKLRANGNGIGSRYQRVTQGQSFFGIYRGNGVGVQAGPLHHTDINNNQYFCDAVPDCVGYAAPVAATPYPVSGLTVNAIMEVNQSKFFGYEGRHMHVQRCDGTWTADLTLSPESLVSYGSNRVDGVVIPNVNLPMSAGCP